MEKLQEMQQLVEQLNRASAAYYNGQQELMTDYEWDAMFDRLKQLEDETGTVLPDSPTARVSEDSIAGQKEAHEFPALSLAKTKQVADVVKWAEGRPVWISWKLDGLTLVVTYDDGRLTKVVTRGNGTIGTNITHLSEAIGGIPQTIPSKEHIVIRGEAVISYDDFNRFLLESGEDYANPRNLASGSLTLKDIDEVRRRKIQWIPFTLVASRSLGASWGSRMDFVARQGMTTVEHRFVENPTPENLEQAIASWNPEQCPYPVDGLVVVYDDTDYAATGSVTGHHATRAGLAFKWRDEAAQTELIEIEWSCAASTISPVAIFRPVALEGTTVKRASLCNISECERLGIGGKGTRLQVIKANKIIPKVIQVDETVGTFDIPDECPVCHEATEIVVSEASGTRTLHCTNPHCPAKQLKKLARFVSKDGMDIDGISEQTLAKFINLGWILGHADIFRLRSHIREIASLEGFGQKSAANIMASIDRARQTDANKLLYALSIPLCGRDVCKRLLSAYPLDELIQRAAEAETTDFFAHIDGIGPEKSASFIAWMKDQDNQSDLRELLDEVQVSQQQPLTQGNACEGLTFVITGDVHHYKNRNELKAYIESQGGRVAGSVSGATSFLINNDAASTSGKNKKAQQLGIPIISEDEFISRFNPA
ncbi:MAG: NAD-dependent DNA ligase LigA [Prevotella sp.]|nr:NAD-dependent DNA ligase LigA [Prevotella sp.]